MAPSRPQRAATKRSYVDTDGGRSARTKGTSSRKRKRTTSSSRSSTSTTSTSKRRGNRGILEKITDIPVDVLYEIFRHLGPLDLLHLSRTSKDLRALLLSKHSLFVWQTSLKDVNGLPPMPKGLNEPQYANLMFDRHCHSCLKAASKHVLWEKRMRLCVACITDDCLLLSKDPFISHSFDRTSFTQSQIQLLIPNCRLDKKVYYHLESAGRIYREAVRRNNDQAAYDKWFKEKFVARTAHLRKVELLQDFSDELDNQRKKELESIRLDRLKAIVERLGELGWKEELEQLSSREKLSRHQLVAVSKPLTDRTWKNMERQLVEHIQSIQAERLKDKAATAIFRRKQLFQMLYSEHHSSLPEIPLMPRGNQVVFKSPFKELIFDMPLLEDMTNAQVQEALESLPILAETWHVEMTTYLAKMLADAGRAVDLDLVSNAFICKKCIRPDLQGPVMYYPTVLSHRCFHVDHTPPYNGNIIPEVFYPHHIGLLPAERVRQIEDVVRTCGLDPKTATRDELDAQDAFLICLPCEQGRHQDTTPVAMRWKSAVRHVIHPDTSTVGPAWKLLTNDTLIELAKRLEHEWTLDLYKYKWDTLVCNHCRRRTLVYDHMRREHLGVQTLGDGIAHWALSHDYYDSGHNEVTFSLLPPSSSTP